MSASGNYPQGATVKFKGGLGRGNHYDEPGTVHIGIVNGPVQFTDGGAYVPIHVRDYNHNVIVASTNIVEIIQ